MEYELYHDESKEGGYWHGILLVPETKKHILLDLLAKARQNTDYSAPLSIKKVNSINRVYDCADSWVQIGVAALMSRIQGQPYPIFLGERHIRQKHYSRFINPIGAKFILFCERDKLVKMTGHRDYGSKVETTFRIGLKGGLHLLGSSAESIHITKMHFDGYEHYRRHLSGDRIIGRLSGLREYCSISIDKIDDRTGNHNKVNCQEYDDCQILQLADLLVGCFRTVLGIATQGIHRQLAQPVNEIIDRYQRGQARMLNSRWRNGFCISQCYLDDSDSWRFEVLECPKTEHGQQLPLNVNLS